MWKAAGKRHLSIRGKRGTLGGAGQDKENKYFLTGEELKMFNEEKEGKGIVTTSEAAPGLAICERGGTQNRGGFNSWGGGGSLSNWKGRVVSLAEGKTQINRAGGRIWDKTDEAAKSMANAEPGRVMKVGPIDRGGSISGQI